MFLQDTYESASSQVHTLRRMIQEKDAAFQRHNNIKKQLLELEQQGTIRLRKQPDGHIAIEALGGGGLVGGAAAGAPLGDLGLFTASMTGNGVLGVTTPAPIGAFAPPPPPPPPAPPLPSEGTESCVVCYQLLLLDQEIWDSQNSFDLKDGQGKV